MQPNKFTELWDEIIAPAIKEFLDKNKNYELAYNLKDKTLEEKLDGLKEEIKTRYEKLKPYFKKEYMKKHDTKNVADEEYEDDEIRADRHKVAALLYLALTYDINNLFIRVSPIRDINRTRDFLAIHAIAYDVSLNCLESFIITAKNKETNPIKKQFLTDFLNNGAFSNEPPLICEKYLNYRDSLIPRMIWATEEASKFLRGINDSNVSFREMRVATNANMLANIFYFLELYSAIK